MRKPTAKPRAQWSEEQLSLAIERVKAGEISKRQAERDYGVPARTIGRRISSGNISKGRLGPDGELFRIIDGLLDIYILFFRLTWARKRNKVGEAYPEVGKRRFRTKPRHS